MLNAKFHCLEPQLASSNIKPRGIIRENGKFKHSPFSLYPELSFSTMYVISVVCAASAETEVWLGRELDRLFHFRNIYYTPFFL